MTTKSVSASKQDAFREGLKEFGRVILIAAVSSAIVAAQAAVGLITDPFWNFVLVAVLSAIGKAWDKAIHKNPETDAIGLVPF